MNESVQSIGRRTSSSWSRLWLLLTSMLASMLFVLFQGGKLAFMLLIISTTIGFYLMLGRWSGIAKSKGHRELVGVHIDSPVIAGTTVSVKINVSIPGIWPIPYVIINDRLIRRGSEEHLFEASFIPDWRRRGMVEYKTTPLRRGFYQFNETDCATQDIFGIFEHKGSLNLPSGFWVLPQKVKILHWRQLHRMIRGTHHHTTTTQALRETTQINGVREYNYGDRLSRIHWGATARTGTLKSKEFEKESLPKTVIVLDRRKSSYENQEQFELAVSVAASLVDYGLHCDLAMGLLSVGHAATFVEPKLGNAQHRLIEHHLIDVEADGTYPLLRVLQDRARQLAPGTFVTIISPVHDEAILPSLAWVEQRQMNPCHMWICSSSKPGEHWMKQLQKAGYWGYPVRALHDLPIVLGGRAT